MTVRSHDQQRMGDQRHKKHLPQPMMHSGQAIEAVPLLQPRRPAHDQKLSKGQRSKQQARELPGSEHRARPRPCVYGVQPTDDAYGRMRCSQPHQRAHVNYPRAERT